MSQYDGLKRELQTIDPDDLGRAVDMLHVRGSFNITEQEAMFARFVEEYPALAELGRRIMGIARDDLAFSPSEIKGVETGVSLSLLGLKELVTLDEMPNIDT